MLPDEGSNVHCTSPPVQPECAVCKQLCNLNGSFAESCVLLEDLTPAGTYTYGNRVDAIVKLPDGLSLRLCQDCAQYIQQLEILELQIIQIENTVFNLFHGNGTGSNQPAAEEEDAETIQQTGNIKAKVNAQKDRRKSSKPLVRRSKGEDREEVEKQHCSSCNSNFRTRRYLAKHLLKVHSTNLEITCGQCSSLFTSLPLLEAHEDIAHAKVTTCPTCAKTVKKASLFAHEKMHAEQDDKHICDVCSRMFTNAVNLNTHMRIHRIDKPFQCNLCDKSFKWSSSLNTHIQAAHNSPKTLFKCDICDRGFKDKTNLRKHEFTHGKLKPFNCKSCDKGFIRRDLYTKHVNECAQPP